MKTPKKTATKKKTSRAKKGNALELARRIKAVAELILEGYGTSEILAAVRENYGVDSRQAMRYIQRALAEYFTPKTEEDFRTQLEVALSKRDLLFRKLFESKQYRDAHTVLMDRDKLAGLYRKAENADAPTTTKETQIFKIDENTNIIF